MKKHFENPLYNEEKEKGIEIKELKGLTFSLKEKQESWDSDRPLQLAITFPREKCNMNCLFCYTKEYKKTEGRALKQEEIDKLLEDAKKMGVKNLLFPGYGESFLNPEFWPTLKKAEQLGLYCLIFTNATIITEKVAEQLKKIPVSLMVKLNSLDRDKQDILAGKKGYSHLQWRGLNALMEAGFNKPDEKEETRLAVHIIISKYTAEDVPQVVKWAIDNNIFPFIEALFPGGNALKHQDLLGTSEEIKKLDSQIRKQIVEMYPERRQNLFGETGCDLETYTIIVEQFSGKSIECFSRRGQKNLGNYALGDSLEEIWAKNNDSRKHRIGEVDPRSPNYIVECGDCQNCPGRRAALERLAQRNTEF